MSTRKFCLSVENWMDDESEILAFLKNMGVFILLVALLLSLATSLAGFLGIKPDNKIVPLPTYVLHITPTSTVSAGLATSQARTDLTAVHAK